MIDDYWTVLYSCIFFFTLNHLVLPSFYVFQSFKSLSEDKKLQWDSRTTSSIHAAFVSVVGLYVVFFKTKSDSDLTWLNEPISTWNVAVSCGYLFADVISMTIYFKRVGGELGFFVHHFVACCGYLLSITQGYLSYYANFRIISEASSPFLNFRWQLYTAGMEKSLLYTINGFCLLFTYFFCRIVPIPYFWKSVYLLAKTESYTTGVGPVGHYGWLSVCAVLDVLNMYWFNILVMKSLKVLKKLQTEIGVQGNALKTQ